MEEKQKIKVWHTLAFGQVKGPFSLSEIEDRVKDGSIQPQDLIYRSGEKKWLPVKDRWQFQKSIAQKRTSQIPKKDWTVLKKTNAKALGQSPEVFQYKPYSLEEIREALHQGVVSYSDWAWTNGMKGWQCIRSLSLFQNKQKGPVFVQKTTEKKRAKKLQTDLGQVTDSELLQSVAEAQPASRLTASLMGREEKPVEAQGPNLAKSFGNIHFDHHSPHHISKTKQKPPPQTESLNIGRSSLNNTKNEEIPSYPLLQKHLEKRRRGFPFKKVVARSLMIGFAIVLSCFVTLLFVESVTVKKPQTLLPKALSFEYDVLSNGRELQFWLKNHPQEKIQLKISSVKHQILSTNDFQKEIQIHLNENGKAVLRLDHWDLAEGYYRFSCHVEQAPPLRRRFFVGKDESLFTQHLASFHQQRQLEKIKIENIKNRRILRVVSSKKAIPQSMKKLYGQVRTLEKGYTRYRQDVAQWTSFYSSWEKSFQQLQTDGLGNIKEQLNLDLSKELHIIEKNLQTMGEKMDQAIKDNIENKDMNLLSPQVAVFLEKIKKN